MIGGGWEFFFVSVLTALVAIVCGVLFASIAWVQMGYGPKEPNTECHVQLCRGNRMRLGSFSAPLVLSQKPDLFGVDKTSLAISCLFLASFALLAVTLKLLSDYTGQGETALKVGSAVLIMVLIIGGFGMLNS